MKKWILVASLIALIIYLAASSILDWQEGKKDTEYANPPEYTTPTEYDNIPEPYYTLVPQQYGLENLRGCLWGRGWNKEYEADIFDCTEMSAFLERWLENRGFHTYIVGGEYEGEPHAWVKVEVAPQKYVLVETTAVSVVMNKDEFNKYHRTNQYETIYDALERCQTAYDWWNVK